MTPTQGVPSASQNAAKSTAESAIQPQPALQLGAHIPSRPFGGALLIAGVVLLLLLMSRWIDKPLTLAINEHVSPGVNQAFKYVGLLGDGGNYAIAALLIYIVALIGIRRNWVCPLRVGFEWLARAAMMVLSTMAVGGMIVWFLKKIVARARPDVLFEQGFYGLAEPFTRGGEYASFPSSHTLAAFAVAAAIGEIVPKWRTPALLVAVLVAVSRLINRQHFLSDVTAAAVIGIMVAYYLAPYVLDQRRRWVVWGAAQK